MTVRHEATPGRQVSPTPVPGWQRPIEWLFGIGGAIAVFLGVFILVAGEEQSIGIGGELSWRVGDIDPAWGFGLLIGGALLLAITVGVVISGAREEHTRTQMSRRAELFWHAGIFVVVNAFIWIQDIATGDGIGYAYWITIPWAVGLAVHALTVYLGRGQSQPGGEEGTPP